MNPAGILLDTGPLVALLSRDDADHARAEQLFSECLPPFRCCEAVIAEACYLLRKVHTAGPAEVVALGRTKIGGRELFP
jgi:predicted nucleic acid-binding protein